MTRRRIRIERLELQLPGSAQPSAALPTWARSVAAGVAELLARSPLQAETHAIDAVHVRVRKHSADRVARAVHASLRGTPARHKQGS
jgi:hypothetical protein